MEHEFSPEQIEALRRLSPSERWEAARSLYWQARRIRADVLRAQHPEWDEKVIDDFVRKLFMYARD